MLTLISSSNSSHAWRGVHASMISTVPSSAVASQHFLLRDAIAELVTVYTIDALTPRLAREEVEQRFRVEARSFDGMTAQITELITERVRALQPQKRARNNDYGKSSPTSEQTPTARGGGTGRQTWAGGAVKHACGQERALAP